MKIGFGLVVVCLSAAGFGAQAQAPGASQEEFIKTHYAKYEYRIPMRDGVKLFVSVYTPQAGAFKDAGPYPFLMTRTPYSCAPYGEDKMPTRLGPSQELLESGYIFVCGDARGRYESEGVFQEMNPHIDDKKSNKDVDESTDTYDTVEFLLKHVENNNGKVGIAGISYPGFYTSASIIDSHPAIKAASPQAPMTNLFFNDDGYHGGAFMLSANYGFYVFLNRRRILRCRSSVFRMTLVRLTVTNTICMPGRQRILTRHSMDRTFCFMTRSCIQPTMTIGRSVICRGI